MLTRDMLMEGLPVLQTERLVLRTLRQSDFGMIADLLSDPQVIQYVNRGSQPAPIRARRLLNQIRSSSANLDSIHYGICWRGTEGVIGLASFQHWSEHGRTAQVGYIVDKSMWGKGVATEAVRRLLQFGFGELQLSKVEARCYEANQMSLQVLRKLGMSRERTVASYGPARADAAMPGHQLDVHIYGICREQHDFAQKQDLLHTLQPLAFGKPEAHNLY